MVPMPKVVLYAALNPSISVDEYREIVDKALEDQKRLLDQVIENMATLPLEQRLPYLFSVLPFLS